MPPRTNMDFAARNRVRSWLQAYMDARGWNHGRLARALGVEQSTIFRIMAGDRNPGLDILLAVQQKLRVSADDVLAGNTATAAVAFSADAGHDAAPATAPDLSAAGEDTRERARTRGRHDPVIGSRIDALRAERGIPSKELYAAMGLEKGEFSRKMRGLTQVFPSEAAVAAEYLGAPRGWPYVSVEEGLLLEALGSRVAEVIRALPEIYDVLARKASENEIG